MINFFRRIRQTLLSENKFRKYIMYALGEIALVMIGILLALQINNANQNLKDAKVEQQYLVALQEEFILNIGKLKALDTLLAVQLDAANELVQNTRPNNITIDNKRLSFIIQEGFRDTYNYFPSSGVMKDLINSGKLSLISNAELRRILADWDSNVTQLKEFEDESKKASQDVVEILRIEGSFRNQMNNVFQTLGTGPSQFDQTNTDLLQLVEFENSVVYFTAITSRLKNAFYPGLINKMENVLSLIKEEIK